MATTTFPITTWYMWDVLETLPRKEDRVGRHIGQRFLPDKDFGSYQVVWEEVKSISRIAGFYAHNDLADPMPKLDWKTVTQTLLHSAARWRITPDELMFFRLPGQPPVSSQYYGTGPAAQDYAAKDAEVVRMRTEELDEGLDNLNEYMRIKALLGRVRWPPFDENGNVIAAADMPVYWGRQDVNAGFPLLGASAAGDGAFEQNASTLTGLATGPNGTGFAWNDAANANPIQDFAVIADLYDERVGLDQADLLAIMSRRMLSHMVRIGAVLDWLLGLNRDVKFVTTPDIKSALQNQWEWAIETYDAKWEYELATELDEEDITVHSVRFLPVGDVLILPSPEYSGMGYLGHCPAPVNADGDDLLQWDYGRYIWRDMRTKPPFTREMGLGQFSFPLMKNLDYRFVLHAWD